VGQELSDGAAMALETEERANRALAEEAGLTYEEAEAEVERARRGDFDPSKHLRTLRGRGGNSDYLDVKYRIEWFRSACPQGSIKTWCDQLDLDRPAQKKDASPGFAMFKCRVRDGNGAESWGYGTETGEDFGDYIEKAETKAIGRALGGLGYGTAGVHEMTKAGQDEPTVVDAPVNRRDYGRDDRVAHAAAARPARAQKVEPASASQLRDMNKLIDELNIGTDGLAGICAEAQVPTDAPQRGMTRMEAGRIIYALQQRKDNRQ
jgi:hypothetical protein